MAALRTTAERRRDIETAIRRVRWFAMVLAVVQVTWLYDPPEGLAAPFDRTTVALGLAGALLVANLVSLAVERAGNARLVAVVGLAQLALDTILVFAVVRLFEFDPESRLWPLYVLPVFEGALRSRLGGALATASAATALIAWDVAIGGVVTTSEVISTTTFRGGILLIVAASSGHLASGFERARATAELQARRLRRLAELSSQLPAGQRSADVLELVLQAACELTGVTMGEVHVRDQGGWTLRAAEGVPGEPGGLLDAILASGGQVDDGVVLVGRGLRSRAAAERPTGPARELGDRLPLHVHQVLVAPIGEGATVEGVLVLGSDDPDRELTQSDGDLVSLLTSHAHVALANARVHEAEARTIAELRALDAVKDEFVQILAHELRGPMTTMTGYASVLRRRWNSLDPTRRDEYLHALEQGAFQLARLVHDVQDVNEADQRTLPIERAVMGLAPVVTRVATEVVAASDVHRLELDLPHDLPDVFADPDRVAQVVRNLVGNAVKYSPDGGLVLAAAEPVDGRLVRLSVTDDGFGIPAHMLSHLFQKFSRLPTPERVQGTGLGLYLTRQLVEAMGGSVGVTSEPGRGSTFHVTFPVATDAGGSEHHPRVVSEPA